MIKRMIWNTNGILVTTGAPGRYANADLPYRGPGYGRPWPVYNVSDSYCGTVHGEVADRIREMQYAMHVRDDGLPSVAVMTGQWMAPQILTDAEIARRYAADCEDCGIPVRALLCATSGRVPLIDEDVAIRLESVSRFLGHDYISPDFEFSAILQDLIWLPRSNTEGMPEWIKKDDRSRIIESLSELGSRLNAHGLFDQEADLMEYISTRWRIAQQTGGEADGHTFGTLLEQSCDLYPCKVWELPRTFASAAGNHHLTLRP